MKLIRYIKNIAVGIWRLMQGMYISMLNFVRPKVTEQYPENRGKHEYFERFRALLTMPHDADNHHKCTACGICMNSCPNGTIKVVPKTVDDPETGKPKRVLDKHLYDLGSCTFCNLCVQSCPFGAIEFTNQFEHSVFTKERLVLQLNRPGSSLKPKPAAPATASAARPANDKPAAITVHADRSDANGPVADKASDGKPTPEKTAADKPVPGKPDAVNPAEENRVAGQPAAGKQVAVEPAAKEQPAADPAAGNAAAGDVVPDNKPKTE